MKEERCGQSDLLISQCAHCTGDIAWFEVEDV